ncbi:MAG: RNA-binding S4 domain-containing protein [Acidimicrobiales bacterium]
MADARIDSWLWAVRLYKTRSAAKSAVVGGHVDVNGVRVKPSQRVVPGDRVVATIGPRIRIVEVVEPIQKRVGAPRAAECLVDHSPPPPEREYVAPAGRRDQGSGRPTKKDRRKLNRLRGR